MNEKECKNPICKKIVCEFNDLFEEGYCSISCKEECLMSLDEFRNKYMKGEERFNFDKFKIVCKKCNSEDIEFGGICQFDDSNCYYPEDLPEITSIVVCKCHSCGNGFKLVFSGINKYI